METTYFPGKASLALLLDPDKIQDDHPKVDANSMPIKKVEYFSQNLTL